MKYKVMHGFFAAVACLSLACVTGCAQTIEPQTTGEATPVQIDTGKCDRLAAILTLDAEARDSGLSQRDMNARIAALDTDETTKDHLRDMASIPYELPQFMPITVARFGYNACVLLALGVEGEQAEQSKHMIEAIAQNCQSEHKERPQDIGSCIDGQAAALISAYKKMRPEN